MWDVRRAQEKMLVNPKMEMCGYFNYIWAKNHMSKAFEQQTTKIKSFHLIFTKITTYCHPHSTPYVDQNVKQG